MGTKAVWIDEATIDVCGKQIPKTIYEAFCREWEMIRLSGVAGFGGDWALRAYKGLCDTLFEVFGYVDLSAFE